MAVNKAPAKAPAKAAAPARKAAGKAAVAAAAANPFTKRLAAMKGSWAERKEEAKKDFGGGVNVPDGMYIAKLTDATLRDGKQQEIYAILQFTVIEGDETGETMSSITDITNDDRVVYFMRDLRRMGVDIDQVEVTDIPDVLPQLVEAAPTMRIKVATKGEYTNMYLQKQVDDSGGDIAPDAEGGAEAGTEGGTEAGEPAAEEIEIGSEVTYMDKKKACTGLVIAIDGDNLTIKNSETKTKVVVDKDVAQVALAAATE